MSEQQFSASLGVENDASLLEEGTIESDEELSDEELANVAGGDSTCQPGVCGFKWCGWWLIGTVWSPVSLNGR